MKTKTKKELHTKTVQELEASIKEAKGELFSLRIDKVGGKLKNLRSLFEKRKHIAILMTILKEREFENALMKSEQQK